VLRFAQAKDIPTFIHESNSFAGKSNIMLGKKATRIFSGTGGMDKFFPKEKLMITGNPVRSGITHSTINREEGIAFFSLDPGRKTILVMGGSLGARSVNEAIDRNLGDLLKAGLQIIWQTGRQYVRKATEEAIETRQIWANAFIDRMEYAYAAADIVVARAGAMTVAELCVAEKPVLFVPYPYAAEDHQTANAKLLVDRHAAIMVKDSEAKDKLVPMILELAGDEGKQTELRKNIGVFGVRDADKNIARMVLKDIGR
jgi:UDP-N-acetylglucosamine--N-acetylmuramyl-(pentapeptide) pyrophosphoryl-undecaprenol N-acetylglucosamine transferase